MESVTRAEAKIHRVGPRHTIYLAKDLVEDSTFPFHVNEDLTVRIEGEALIVDKTGRSSFRGANLGAASSSGEQVMKTLDSLNFSPVASKAERIHRMLTEIHEAELLESGIRHMPKNEHAIFLWEDQSFLDMVLSEFFDPGVTGRAPKGLFSAKPAAFQSVDNLLHEEISGLSQPMAVGKIKEWMTRVHSSNRSTFPTRIAIEDYSSLLKNGSAKGLLELEENIGRHVKENMTILCGYNITKLVDSKQLQRFLGVHGYAILDQPFRVYRQATI